MGRWTRLVALFGAVLLVSSGCDWLQWGGGPTHRGTIYEPVISKSNVATLVPCGPGRGRPSRASKT